MLKITFQKKKPEKKTLPNLFPDLDMEFSKEHFHSVFLQVANKSLFVAFFFFFWEDNFIKRLEKLLTVGNIL